MEKVSYSIKSVGGVVVSILTLLFGQFWFLFAFYLALNIVDWLTGWAKARKKGEGSSAIGIRGIVKKTGYWLLIAIAFGCSFVFAKMGEVLSINLSFMIWLGWYTLAILSVNELVSILENLVELGYKVPFFMIKGLKIAGNAIDAMGRKILSKASKDVITEGEGKNEN
jgi:toxin secretion/phage lysis holin